MTPQSAGINMQSPQSDLTDNNSNHKNKFHATHLNWIQAVNIKILSYYLGIWLCPRCLLAAGKHWMQTIYALEEKREGKLVVLYKVGKKDCEKFSSLQYTFY